MKKLLFWAAFAAVVLTSCQEEKDVKENAGGKNEVAFILQGGAATRANDAVESVPAREGISKEIAQIGDRKVFLEETIMDLNSVEAETRGTPVYTENLGYLYRDKLSVHAKYSGGTQDVVFKQNDDAPMDNAWRYSAEFPANIWANKSEQVEFYLRMPSDMESHGVSALDFNTSAKTKFSYASPSSAVDQQDIIFAYKQMSFNDYYSLYTSVGGARIKLYHALTGVKFAIANTPEDRTDNKIQVTKISFVNVKNTGNCEVTTSTEGVSSIAWDGLDIDDDIKIAQAISASDVTTYTQPAEGASDPNHFPASFYGGGTNQNLNTTTATKTFWLIPQGFASTQAKLRIDYTFNERNEYLELKLADVLPSGTTWDAGQLRTYTIRLDEVKVKIEDDIEMVPKTTETVVTPWGNKPANSYIGSVKNGVEITNTGNTDAFIRVALVGQWRTPPTAANPYGDPVFGYTDFTEGVQLVDSWYMDQFVLHTERQGKFYDLAAGEKWVLNEDDGFYYYTDPVAPGKIIGTAPADATNASDYLGNPLFTKYEVGHVPAAAIAGNVQDIHFTLEIAVQAVSAKKLNGLYYTYQEAWARANSSASEE